MKIFNAYYCKNRNTGDLACSPRLYFTFPCAVETLSITDAPKFDACDCLIFGGGGIMHNSAVRKWVDQATCKTVSWGMGHNTHGSATLEWPSWLNKITLCGIRDWPNQGIWLPCSSCMHPAFDINYKIEHEAVVYDHRDTPTGLKGFPTKKNDEQTMADVVAFLGSGETVITTSYHGAYWATLLGRKVIVTNAFSNRFLFMKHSPFITTAAAWQSAMPLVYTEALEECRSANRNFYQKVMDLLL